MFRRFLAERAEHPERYVMTENAMNTVGALLTKGSKTVPAAVELFTIITEHYPHSARGFLGLADAYLKAGHTSAAAEARRRAEALERSP